MSTQGKSIEARAQQLGLLLTAHLVSLSQE